MADKLGRDAKLYYSATPITVDAASTGGWSEVTLVRDLTTPMDADESDVTTRASGGWTLTRASHRGATIDFDLLWDSDNAGQVAIRDAFLAGSAVSLAVMDGDIAVAGSEGLAANFSILGFGRGEPLREGMTVAVSAKPRSFPEWYETT